MKKTTSYVHRQDQNMLPVPETLFMTNIKEEFEKDDSWGISTAIDLHACDAVLIRDAEKIKEFTTQLSDLLKVKRFGDCIVVHFGEKEEIAGYSLVQLIETSLISGHFANKTNHAYIDIFSCRYYDPNVAVEFCRDFFKAKDVQSNYILRK